MSDLIAQASFMAHGYCLLWQPWLVALFASSDLLIFLAYAAIPLALLRFLRRRPDIEERRMVWLFASFILLCGLTHLVSIVTLWIPIYPVLAVLKLATGIVSAITAAVLFHLVPKLAQLPHPRELQERNERLKTEIEAHEKTLLALRAAQEGLEHKVAERTADLDRSNQQMRVLMREMAHRSRNLLTVVQSMARQGARFATGLPDFVSEFTARLQVLADATNQMTEGWDNRSSNLGAVLSRQIAPYAQSYPDRIEMSGSDVVVPVEVAGQVALAVHELATNAVKHGAFAAPEGRAELSWRAEGHGGLVLCWRETGGKRAALAPVGGREGGFGSILLARAVPTSVGGTLRYEPTADGLIYELSIPADMLALRGPVVPEIVDDFGGAGLAPA